MNGTNLGRIIAGVILLLVSVWAFFTFDDPTARYLGGAILATLGAGLIASAFMKRGGGGD